MTAKKKASTGRQGARAASETAAVQPRDIVADVRLALTWLERRGTKKNREGMARYGIVADKMFGVSMGTMQSLARQLGKSHKLAQAPRSRCWPA